MLIVLEGLDGAGKSTQINLLKNHFEQSGERVELMHFPRFDTPVFGEMIAKFLRGDFGAIESVHPMLVALIYAEDRRDAAPILREWLDAGVVVILDRYLYSNIAFQCAKVSTEEEAEYLRDWILETEFNNFSIPKPNVNLFLDVPLGFVEEKLSNSREGDDREYLQGKKDIHEESLLFQEKVRRFYLKECGKGLQRVDCSDGKGNMLSAEDNFQNILNSINKSLRR